MPSLYSSLALLATTLTTTLVSAQCQNNVAVYNPNIRTQSSNGTSFIVPVPKAAVLSAAQEKFPLQNLRLLDVPSTPDLFPNGFPEGMHPVLVTISTNADIRMSALQIDGILKNAGIFATFVAKGDSDSPLSATLNQYIAGPNGPLPQGLVPALASSLLFAGTPLRLGKFTPASDAYMSETPEISSSSVAWALVPNPISGPGVEPNAVDTAFTTISQSEKYGARTIKTLMNQPLLLPSGQCQRNQYYFNNATAVPVLRSGNVTFGPAADGIGLTSGGLMKASADGSGVYVDVEGLSACSQQVGNTPEDCDEAVKNVDPASLE